MPKKKPRTEAVPSTLQEAVVYFADPDVALMYFVTLRWPDGTVICPTCGSANLRFLANRRVWKCSTDHARRQFSVKVGTIMEDSPIGLDKWLLAMWMLTNCKNGVSSYEIARALGITQKSAWFLNHRIRKALQEGPFVTLGGSGKTVEVDETFIGAQARFTNAAQKWRASKGGQSAQGPYKFTGKAMVMGMLERGGRVVAKVIKTRQRSVLQPNVLAHVARESQVVTDEHHAYIGLGDHEDYEHKIIDHPAAYVDGQVHTNGIENFWSLLKRGIRGTCVSVEPFHLFRYLDEQMYRSIVDKRLTYKDLIGAELVGAQS